MIFHLKWNWIMLITQILIHISNFLAAKAAGKYWKPLQVSKYKQIFCLHCLVSFLSGKKEESQCPACKINILKPGIILPSDLQTMLSLLKIQCKTCSKKFLMSMRYNYYTKHIQNCSLEIHQAHFWLLISSIYPIMICQYQWRMPYYMF